MVKQRNSIRKLGEQLSEMVINGGHDTTKAIEIARTLNRLCREGGVYIRRYENPEERVLMRHLNLYKNKRNKAQTTVEKARWQGKIGEQEAKLAEFRRAQSKNGTADLDLDGL